MTPKLKFLMGGALVLGSAGWLMASSVQTTATYYLTPSELHAKVVDDASFHETGVKMGAHVVPGTIIRAENGREVDFRVTDGTQEYRVVYRGLIPDTFSDSAEVVVEGRLGRDGTFEATTLLAKCGSRFEAAPGEGAPMPSGYQPPAYPGSKPAAASAPTP
jgi:cytochrome c-type biogenesis protein CcmE